MYKKKPYKKVYVRVSDDAPTFPIHPQQPTFLWKRIKQQRKADKAAGVVRGATETAGSGAGEAEAAGAGLGEPSTAQ